MQVCVCVCVEIYQEISMKCSLQFIYCHDCSSKKQYSIRCCDKNFLMNLKRFLKHTSYYLRHLMIWSWPVWVNRFYIPVCSLWYMSTHLSTLYLLMTIYTVVSTVKSAYKEPAYKELPIIRNWFSWSRWVLYNFTVLSWVQSTIHMCTTKT